MTPLLGPGLTGHPLYTHRFSVLPKVNCPFALKVPIFSGRLRRPTIFYQKNMENSKKIRIFPAAYGGQQIIQVEITWKAKLGPEKIWPPEAAEENFARLR